MEISEVKKRVVEAIERSRKAAAERRVRMDESSRDYATFLEQVATPMFRQVANVLKAHGHAFTLMTPSGGLRLTSDRSAEDYIEIDLDTTGEFPEVMGRSNRARGRRVITTELAIGTGQPLRQLTEEDVLKYLLTAIEPFVER